MNRCRITVLAVMTFLLCIQMGCTSDMWRAANWETLTYIKIEGVLAKQDAPPQLIVEYGGFDVKSNFFVVPFEPPLLYVGKRTTIQEIKADITPSQLDAVSKHALSRADGHLAVHSPGHVSFALADQSRGYWQFHGYVNIPSHPHNDVMVVVITPDGVPMIGANSEENPVVSAGSRVLVLPAEQPRLASEQRNAKLTAALLTPLTLAADVLTFPVAIAWRIIKGD